MAFDQIRLNRPLSRLEMLALLIAILLCAWMLMKRLNFLEAVAEARALDITLRSIRTGIMVNVATRLVQDKGESIAALAGANPVGTVIDPPAGYIGALSGANPDNIQPGQWYFDEDGRFLAYQVVNRDYFEHDGSAPARVRVRLKLNYDDRNGNHAYDPGVDAPLSVSMQLVEPPRWKL